MAHGPDHLQPGHTAFLKLTDHLPVILTLRTRGGDIVPPQAGGLRIVAAIPNPDGDDRPNEEVWIQNTGLATVPLAGWKIADKTNAAWTLDATDGENGSITAGQTVKVKRRNRPMFLNNVGSETIKLLSPTGDEVDSKTYSGAASGQVVSFSD